MHIHIISSELLARSAVRSSPFDPLPHTKSSPPLAALEGGGATSSYTSTAVTGGMGGSLYISLLWDTSLFLYSETLRGSWGSSTLALPGLDAEALARAGSMGGGENRGNAAS